MRAIILPIIWAIVGLLVYLWLGEFQVFSWNDPWVYIYMVFWPVPIVWNCFLLIVCLILLYLFIWWILDLLGVI